MDTFNRSSRNATNDDDVKIKTQSTNLINFSEKDLIENPTTDDVPMWGKAALATLSKAPTLILEDDDRSSNYSYSSEELNIQREDTMGDSPRMCNRNVGRNSIDTTNGEPIAEGYIVS